MNRRATLFIGVLGLVLSTIGLTNCGQRLCVGGIGDCTVQNPPDRKNPLVGDSQFNLAASKTEVFEGDKIEIRIENSAENWEVIAVEGPILRLDKTGTFTFTFTAAGSISGASQFTKLRGKDLSRFKSETETPLAFDEIMIETKKKLR